MEELKYPIGRFQSKESYSSQEIDEAIKVLEEFPHLIRQEVRSLDENQLETQYRPEGWTIRQVVHHCADSHINSFIRFKLTLTEDKPIIKPYSESLWAELYDSKNFPIEDSLKILDGVHSRLISLLRSLNNEQLKREFIHPEKERKVSIAENIVLYSWHSKHHLAHIVNLKKQKGW